MAGAGARPAPVGRSRPHTLYAHGQLPSCGAENPAGFRFCGAGGAALAQTSAGEVRKTVTVLFCDMLG